MAWRAVRSLTVSLAVFGGFAVPGAALLARAPTAGAAPAAGALAAPVSRTPAARASRMGGGPLPDSLLARVGNRRHISIANFRHSWHQVAPPQRPDSLTPEGARRFLDLLIGKEVLGEVALRTRWTWTARESADYLGLADRMVMSTMVDSALRATYLEQAATGDTIRDVEKLGTLARERAAQKLRVRFDTTLTRRLADDWAAIPRPSRDSSLMAQMRVLGTMPRVAPSDAGRVVAHSADGDFKVSELIESWSRLDPLRRPRVGTPSQIEDLVSNALFERILRREAVRRKILAWPEFAGALDREREYIAVTHLVAREVYDGLHSDSLTLRRYYDGHRHDFSLPLRIRVLQLDLASRDAATKMALDLRDPARADSLMARGKRSRADYTVMLTAERDGPRFERALAAGTGAVLGPDSTSNGWSVSRVLEVIPARDRTFEEALPLVEHAWYGEEGERRMVATLARLRRQVPVAINPRAIQKLVAEGIGAEP